MTWTRLHDACQHQKATMVEQLTKTCAEEAKMVDDNGSTPLHIACRGNPPLDVIQALLNAFPSTVCDQDVDGNTPLHIAASQPSMSLAVLEALLNVCPIAASVKNKEGLMPLHMTCRYAPTNDGVIEFLMTVNLGALECRTKMGQLVNHHHDHHRISTTGRSDDDHVHAHAHLHFVSDLAEKANLESAATRYALGEQIRDGSYPLLMAIQNGASCTIIEKMLNRHREDHLLHLTNKFYETALHLALMRADGECLVTMLLQTTQNCLMVDTKEAIHGNLPIHVAAMMGCSETVAKGLLRLHPDSIFDKNFDAKTPLDLALEYGRCKVEVIRMFEITEHLEGV